MKVKAENTDRIPGTYPAQDAVTQRSSAGLTMTTQGSCFLVPTAQRGN